MAKFFRTAATRRLQEGDRLLPVTDKPAAPPTTSYGYGTSGSGRSWGAGGDGSKWRGGLASSGVAPTLNHSVLRANARSAFHTSLQARAVVVRHTDSVVDVGLKLNSTPDANLLGITAEQAEKWADDVDSRFDAWARNRKSTLAENQNFYQAQRLAGLSQQRDGEYFIRFKYSLSKDLLNPLQLGFIDPSQIRGHGFTTTYGVTPLLKDGIERDINGKETAYYVYVQQADFSYKAVTIPAVGSRSKRRMMVHGYQLEYAGQGRGYPPLSHALQELENITDYASSELKKAIAQSTINMWVKPSKDNVAGDPFKVIEKPAPVGPVGISPAAQAIAEANNIDPADAVEYFPIPEATVGVPGSVGVFNLNEGEEIKPFANTAPVDGFEKFVNAVASHLSASLSIPLEVVLMKFGENYSASRAALMLFWRVANIWRDEMASDLLNPVYENWLAGEIAAGRISAPGWNDPRMREAWLKNTWIGAPMPNIDPQKTAKADQLYVEMGAQTLDRVAQNLNGSSGKSNRAKLTRELQELPPVPWGKSNSDGGANGPPGEDAADGVGGVDDDDSDEKDNQ